MSFLSHLSWKKALTSIYYMYVVEMDVLTAVPPKTPKKTTQTTNDYKVFLINHMVQALDGLLQRKSLRFAVQWH